MKKIILAVLALAVLGGGGFGAYMYLNKPDATLSEAVTAKVEHEEKTHEGGSEIYVQLDPIYVPVIDKNGVRQMVSMVVAIEVNNYSQADRARALKPKLTSYILQDMYGVFGRETKSGRSKIRTSLIKYRVDHVSKRILGSEAVAGIRLQAVTQRKV